MKQLLCVAFLCLPLLAWAAPVPQRVVSLNLCTDQLLLMLLPRERIAMLSQLATDRSMSWVAEQATGIPLFDGSVERIIELNPGLILAGTMASRESSAVLLRLGYPVRTLAMPETIAESLRFIAEIAELLGEPAAGQALIEQTARRLDTVRAASRTQRPRLAVVYLPNGLSPGANTLKDELLAIAGWRNLSRELGIDGYGELTLESLVLHRPERMIVDASDLEHTSMAQQLLRHPALTHHITIRTIPTATWMCGGPQIADAAEALLR